jgi:hypothetical protein
VSRRVLFIICACLFAIGDAFSAEPAQAQERIYGAAIPYAESYPRGEAVDQQYDEYLSQVGPYAFGAPYGYFGYPGWGQAVPWGPRYLPWGLNSYLGPRYAPYAWQPSPYYAWPYEWAYRVAPETPYDGAPLEFGAFGFEPYEELPYQPPLLGPRRFYW